MAAVMKNKRKANDDLTDVNPLKMTEDSIIETVGLKSNKKTAKGLT